MAKPKNRRTCLKAAWPSSPSAFSETPVAVVPSGAGAMSSAPSSAPAGTTPEMSNYKAE